MSLPVNADLLPAIEKITEDASQRISNLVGFPIKVSVDLKLVLTDEKPLRKLVCDVFDVKWAQVISHSKKKEFVAARHAYCYLTRTFFPHKSLLNIAESVGRKDHTTVLNAINVVKDRMEVNDALLTSRILHIIKIIEG